MSKRNCPKTVFSKPVNPKSRFSLTPSASSLALDRPSALGLLKALFQTHSFYHDRPSRHAVQRCLVAIFKSHDSELISPLVAAIRQEAQKNSIAQSNAFVLVEWCCLLMQNLAGIELWDKLGNDILLADAEVLEKCLQGQSKGGLAQSALVIGRRGFRALVSNEESRESAITSAVQLLSAKGTQPTAKNAVLLGIIAGVCSRNSSAQPLLSKLKASYLSFYTREIIGSRTPVPRHLADGLRDFFSAFVSPEDLEKEIFPALEKGLLRAPEVVLDDLVTPLVRALPEEYDLSKALSSRLLKPLLSNVKSSNLTIRNGAVSAFKQIVALSRDAAALEQVADEIIAPLKSGKLASADHRVLHSEMLVALPVSPVIASKIATALPVLLGKEGNEAALSAETLALNAAANCLLRGDGDVPKGLIDAYLKGLADKKLPIRRIWILRTGEILFDLSRGGDLSPNAVKFAESAFPRLMDTFNEVITNPLAASQNGLVTGGLVVCSVASLLQRPECSSLNSISKKVPVLKHALTLEPKPSFLLSPRIYTKLSSDDDFRWLCRGLSAVAPGVTSTDHSTVKSAWAQAFIFLICSPQIALSIRKEATDALSDLYIRSGGIVSEMVISGVWDWVQALEGGDKESTAILSKAAGSSLHLVIKAICLTPAERSAREGPELSKETLESQMCSLIVLARTELVPRSRWIDLCLNVGLDPGDLSREYEEDLLKEVVRRTSFDQKVNLCP